MDERQQLTFWRGNLAIQGFGKLVLGSATVQRGQCAADRETLAHGGKTCFPWWIRVGDAITWRNHVPRLSFAPKGFEQRDRSKVRVALQAHSAAFPCWSELWTGRRAL